MNSTIIDLAIRIKNGYMAEREEITALYSKLSVNVLTILKERKYIKNFEVVEDGHKKSLSIELLYNGKEPAISEVKIVSKPGRRVYFKKTELQSVLGGLGLSLISTSKGVMTDRTARKEKLGGEVLFNIW